MSEETIKLGKSAQNNWSILDQAEQNHTWFHLKSFPSPYVIVNKSIDNLDKETIIEAATLCKKNSKYKNHKKLVVNYTSVKNLKKGSVVGEVIIQSNKKCKQITL